MSQKILQCNMRNKRRRKGKNHGQMLDNSVKRGGGTRYNNARFLTDDGRCHFDGGKKRKGEKQSQQTIGGSSIKIFCDAGITRNYSQKMIL